MGQRMTCFFLRGVGGVSKQRRSCWFWHKELWIKYVLVGKRAITALTLCLCVVIITMSWWGCLMNYLITVPLWGCLMNCPITVSWWGCLMNYLTQVLWAPWNCVQTPIQVTAAPPLPPLTPSTIPHAYWAPLLATNHSHRYNTHHCHIKRQVSLPPLRPSFTCRCTGSGCHWFLSHPGLV